MTGPETVVLRPRRARQVIYPVAAVVVAALTLGAIVLPASGPGAFGLVDRVGMVLLGLGIAYLMHRLAAVRVVLRPGGLEVVNLVRRTRLAWAQVVGVRLSRDDPWVLLDLSDGETLPVMGIQQADGEHAREHARQLSRRVVEGSRTTRDD